MTSQTSSSTIRDQFNSKISSAFDGDDPTWAVAATEPRSVTSSPEQSELLPDAADPSLDDGSFLPTAPSSIEEAGLTQCQVEALVCKYLLNTSAASGRAIADQMSLPFRLIEILMTSLKRDQLVVFKADAPFGDYVYELTPTGVERARRYAQQSTYFGAAPVPLEDYRDSVRAQSLQNQKLTLEGVREAFSELVLGHKLTCQLGEAMNLGKGMFVYGHPGNGKTSISETIIRAFSETIWIPRALLVGGETVRLFDPIHHREVTLPENHPKYSQVDHRWVRIERPTILVASELELQDFDITTNPVTRINEAPIQLKSNCGVLVIDDFGRNRFRPSELLNRLIVPLEKQIDALHLSSGRTFQVPFDEMIVFSTNLNPLELVDEAFLRRIPFSIQVNDPTVDEFKKVFQLAAKRHGIDYLDEDLQYLIEKHYKKADRPFRFCHPQDILEHIGNACEFRENEMRVTKQGLDQAVENLLALRSEVTK